MSLEPLEKLRLLGFTFWKQANNQITSFDTTKELSLFSIGKNHLVYINPNDLREQKTDIFLKQLSIATGGEGKIQELQIRNIENFNNVVFMLFGEIEEFSQEFIDKFQKSYSFSPIGEVIGNGSIKKDIWLQITLD